MPGIVTTLDSAYRNSTHGGEVVFYFRGPLGDDLTFTLPVLSSGARGFCEIGDDEERVDFSIKADGTVNLMILSTNVVANADTDGKFCIGTSVASPVVVKNRLGASKQIVFKVWY